MWTFNNSLAPAHVWTQLQRIIINMYIGIGYNDTWGPAHVGFLTSLTWECPPGECRWSWSDRLSWPSLYKWNIPEYCVKHHSNKPADTICVDLIYIGLHYYEPRSGGLARRSDPAGLSDLKVTSSWLSLRVVYIGRYFVSEIFSSKAYNTNRINEYLFITY